MVIIVMLECAYFYWEVLLIAHGVDCLWILLCIKDYIFYLFYLYVFIFIGHDWSIHRYETCQKVYISITLTESLRNWSKYYNNIYKLKILSI
jgi:hypothetical protein